MHREISIIKSLARILAYLLCIFVVPQTFFVGVILGLLIGAEITGIVEEYV